MTPESTSPKPSNRKTSAVEGVEDYLSKLDHPRKPEILVLRQLILSVDPTICEAIKWNAPSFHTTEHFATMNLRVKNGIGVILHFGAKKNALSETGVHIPDPHSLLDWLAKDRALVTFADMGDIGAKRAAFTGILRLWIQYL
ncbi:DUF1801 domain-containing protein [Paludibaculum fermentans]|uniref:DUF1801 domain-containing protein n=1 Tax=Paludibaculum fermentans TaxID=1473598 RepID=UPI003EBD3ED3